MWCPYKCPLDETKTLAQHFKLVHPHRIIKNDCYSILQQSSFYHQFLLNEREDGIFLSKCSTIAYGKVAFCTTCLTGNNPKKYGLVFSGRGNPTLTRMLQTRDFDEMCQGDHDAIFDFDYIAAKVGFSKCLQCRFICTEIQEEIWKVCQLWSLLSQQFGSYDALINSSVKKTLKTWIWHISHIHRTHFFMAWDTSRVNKVMCLVLLLNFHLADLQCDVEVILFIATQLLVMVVLIIMYKELSVVELQ